MGGIIVFIIFILLLVYAVRYNSAKQIGKRGDAHMFETIREIQILMERWDEQSVLMSNLDVIINPNYSLIIHKNNPHFNRKKYQFEFQNGEVLRLKLYEHLKA